MAVSSEALTRGLTVYGYVKPAAKQALRLRAIADQLGERFKAFRPKVIKKASVS